MTIAGNVLKVEEARHAIRSICPLALSVYFQKVLRDDVIHSDLLQTVTLEKVINFIFLVKCVAQYFIN